LLFSISTFLLTAIFAPKRSKLSDARDFSSGISVELPLTSPPYAALADVLSQDQIEPHVELRPQARNQEIPAVARPVALAQGPNRLEKLVAERAELQRVIDEEIRRSAEEIGVAAAQAAATVIEVQDQVAREVVETREQLTGQASAQPTVTTVRLADLKIDRNELLKSLFFPLVAAGRDPSVALQEWTRATAAIGQAAGDRLDRSLQVRNVQENKTSASLIPPAAAPAVMPAEAAPTFVNRSISGVIELRNGVALTDSTDRLKIFREIDGEPVESGQTWVREAKYQIVVAETRGRLVAELESRSGDLLGRGEIDLNQLAFQDRESQLSNVNIQLLPVPRGLSGFMKSAYSYGTKVVALDRAEIRIEDLDLSINTDRDGKFSDENIQNQSSVIIRSRRAGYWGSIALARAGKHNALTLYPDQMMGAFASLMSKSSPVSSRRPAIIWGRITKEGQAVAGARVELLTGEKEIRPVYFNKLFLPDESLQQSSSNGLYAFYDVDPEVHAVQVIHEEFAGESVFLPAQAGYVSQIDLEVSAPEQTSIKVFDGLSTEQPLAATLFSIGTDRKITVDQSGETTARLAKHSGFAVIDAQAGDEYARSRTLVAGHTHFLLVPMIRSDWLESIRSARRINQDVHVGTIVGFVPGDSPFQVFLGERKQTSASERIIYFDARGRLLNSNIGVPGGGYVIFNVKEGFTTVAVSVANREGLQAQTALVADEVVNVIYHRTR